MVAVHHEYLPILFSLHLSRLFLALHASNQRLKGKTNKGYYYFLLQLTIAARQHPHSQFSFTWNSALLWVTLLTSSYKSSCVKLTIGRKDIPALLWIKWSLLIVTPIKSSASPKEIKYAWISRITNSIHKKKIKIYWRLNTRNLNFCPFTRNRWIYWFLSSLTKNLVPGGSIA